MVGRGRVASKGCRFGCMLAGCRAPFRPLEPRRSRRAAATGRWMMAEMPGATSMTPDSTLDATGLLCPLPVLKARRALKAVQPGGILEVLATDPGATKDFEH